MAAGTIYVEINLDDSPYQKAQQKLLESTKSASATIESSFKNIGTATSAVFESMKEKIVNSFTAMANYAKSAATTIYESMKNAAAWMWDSMKSAAGWVGDAFKGVSQSVKDFVSQTSNTIAGMAAAWAAQRTAISLFGEAAGAALGTVFTWIGALIIGYKSLDFAIGLITGKSYKSEAIDWLRKEITAVSDLAEAMGTTMTEAQRFRATTELLGNSQKDVIAAYNGARDAVAKNELALKENAAALKRGTDGNGDLTKSISLQNAELTRLGIVYKDANGNLLDTDEILQNASDVLEKYTEGWDRNQAALAIGMGTYDQIQAALEATGDETDKAREDLEKYHLGITKGTMDATSAYGKAMREFNYETKMMSDGLTRALADQIMPAFTSLANFFSGGWPFIVNLFRYSMATITSLGWGLYNGFVLIKEGWALIFSDIGSIISGFAIAAIKALKGDFEGAKAALSGIFKDVSKNSDSTWKTIEAASKKSSSAMTMAWAMDGRKMQDTAKATGKTWEAVTEKRKSEAENAEKQIAEATRKAQIEIQGYGQTTYEKDLARIESEKTKWEAAGASKASISKWYTAEITINEQKMSDEVTKLAQEDFDLYLKYEKEKRDTAKKAAEDAKKDAADKLMAYQVIYKDLAGYEGQYYEVSRQLIEGKAAKELEILNKGVTDKQTAEANMLLIAEATTLKLKQLDIEKGKSSDDFFAGFKSGIDEIELKQAKWGQVGYDTFKAMSSGMATTFSTVFEDVYKGKLQSLSDYSTATWDSMRAAFFKAIGEMAAQQILIKLSANWAEGGVATLRIVDKLLGLTGAVSNLSDYASMLTGGGSMDEAMSLMDMAGYAKGGTPPVGKPVWVGEEGPELLFLNSPGYVMNNPDSRAYAARNGGYIPGYASGGWVMVQGEQIWDPSIDLQPGQAGYSAPYTPSASIPAKEPEPYRTYGLTDDQMRSIAASDANFWNKYTVLSNSLSGSEARILQPSGEILPWNYYSFRGGGGGFMQDAASMISESIISPINQYIGPQMFPMIAGLIATAGLSSALSAFGGIGQALTLESLAGSAGKSLLKSVAMAAIKGSMSEGAGGSTGGMGAGGVSLSLAGGDAGGTGDILNALLSGMGGNRIISARSGLDYVPRDGYPIIAHEGEAVLKKSDAAAWRGDKGQIVVSVENLVRIDGNLIADEKVFNEFVEKIDYRLSKLAQWGH